MKIAALTLLNLTLGAAVACNGVAPTPQRHRQEEPLPPTTVLATSLMPAAAPPVERIPEQEAPLNPPTAAPQVQPERRTAAASGHRKHARRPSRGHRRRGERESFRSSSPE
jgi:hypothetical protein